MPRLTSEQLSVLEASFDDNEALAVFFKEHSCGVDLSPFDDKMANTLRAVWADSVLKAHRGYGIWYKMFIRDPNIGSPLYQAAEQAGIFGDFVWFPS